MSFLNIDGRIVDISQPTVMGIVNATPDSFWEGSRKQNAQQIVEQVAKHLENGATFVDIGGYSTRPNAEFVSPEEEAKRVVLALAAIEDNFGKDINISIDTFRSSVVKEVLKQWGRGFIVNDIQAGEQDSEMLKTVADAGLPYIAMHSKGNPKTMDSLNNYSDIVSDIMSYFVERLSKFKEYGIGDVVLDLGFGFAKNAEQNFELIRRFEEFKILDKPQLVGISRKRMIWQTLNISAAEALNGTSVLNSILLQKGASILRVHDSLEAVQAIKLISTVR